MKHEIQRERLALRLYDELEPEEARQLDEHLAESWLAEARKIPGWDDGPEYAPHPVRLQEVDPDEEFL